ncbi:hypothetical protein ACTV2B_001673 [Cronobacter turicensis]|uniref:hypothetical protein n=1 Tax=Cronobacter turicensis TaxID=413502 RepID=UPI003570C9AD
MGGCDNNDLMIRLTGAVSAVFSQCIQENEYYVAQLAVAEFLVAVDLSPDDAIEVMQRAQGMDAMTDDCLDELIGDFGEGAE